jgi:hypothetical protein
MFVVTIPGDWCNHHEWGATGKFVFCTHVVPKIHFGKFFYKGYRNNFVCMHVN